MLKPSSFHKLYKYVFFGLFMTYSLFAQSQTQQSKRIMCIGAHPDDPETGCGGTLAKHNLDGDSIVILYLTTGEAGIVGMSHQESAQIRKGEAMQASKILNAKPIFFGQIDGATFIDDKELARFIDTIQNYKPQIVYSHWPMDSHKDHQITSLLTIQAWYRLGKSFDLFFYEVCAGNQTTHFKPTSYVDISKTEAIKRQAVFCHVSQNPEGIYNDIDCNHGWMEKNRGDESGYKRAEAFIAMKE